MSSSITTASQIKHEQQAEREGELRLCSRRGDLDRVQGLVETEYVNVNCANETGNTPLHGAVGFEQTHVARVLLEHGANANAANDNEWTVLGLAVVRGDTQVAQLLIDYGADVDKPFRNVRDNSVYSPLGYAIYRRDVGMVTLLLRYGAQTEELTYKGHASSAMLIACDVCDVAIIQLLLEQVDGIMNSFVPRNGERSATSPLCVACKNNNMEMAQFLIENGARVIFPGEYPECPSPLVHAVGKGSMELLQFLLESSPFSVSAATSENTLHQESDGTLHPLTEPLSEALQRNKLEAAQLLVDHGANVNDGPSPLLCLCAQKVRWYKSARFLLRQGANVNRAHHVSGQTPLWVAACHGNTELVKDFLKAGADVTIRDNDGETPLGVAHRNGHNGVVYLLILTTPQVWWRLKGYFVRGGDIQSSRSC